MSVNTGRDNDKSMNYSLTVNHISKSFGEIRVLENVSAKVEEKKVTAFIGPNGAGKTTLFHIIAGTLASDEGEVTMNGMRLTGMPPHVIARLGIGRQFQDARVFRNLTTFENVLASAVPHKRRDAWFAWIRTKRHFRAMKRCNEIAMHWLEYVGLQDKKNYLACELSFGQQRLLTIARLFAQNAKILLMDEPTAGLGYTIMNRVIELIQRTVEENGTTIALIEHNMSAVKDLSDWIHFMHEGKVAFSGKRAQVLDNQNVREMYMGF